MEHSLKKKLSARAGLVLLAFIAFIALGLPDGLLGVGWPSIRASFIIPLDSLGMLLIAGTAGYLTSSFSSGYLITRLGIGGVLAASCALTGTVLIGNTLVPSWGMMVALGVFAGLGAGAIDAGLNTYIAANFGEGLMQWLHASYGIGITLGPIIMTTALNTFSSWRLGYDIVGAFQLTLAACFAFTLPMWKQKKSPAQPENVQKLTDYKTSYRETLRQPRVWLSVLLFFLYVGAEVSLGTWAYTLLTESRSILPNIAGLLAGSYWATFTIGRVLAGLYTKRIGGYTLIRLSLLGALLGAAFLWWHPSEIFSLLGVALVGFAIAPIFPALVSGTSQRVGAKYAANTIGIQIAVGGLGASLIPGLVGVLARYISLEIIPVCLFTLFASLLGLYSLSMRIRKAN
ncbi:MAG TPA: MFS transporter [Anaerolineaceae bacterium]|nr:MFS transporter [Anaerolineaceae bacterium]